MTNEMWDMLRWVNASIAALVVVLLTMDTIHRWHAMSERLKRVIPWVTLTYVVIAYGSGEVAANSDPVEPGLRVTFLTLNLIGLVIALLYRIDEIEEPRSNRL